ncbi:MAG: DUF2177 family protein [Vicinamibacterales bacterium]
MDFLKQWAAGLAAFVVVDFVWIGLVANGFYRRALGPLLRMDGDRMDPRLLPAAVMYALVVAGLILFALPRGRGTLADAAAWSALYGFIAYGVYDLTNYATLQAFPLRMVLVDMAWGAAVCGLTGAAAWMARPA